jgi:hypothetical protein
VVPLAHQAFKQGCIQPQKGIDILAVALVTPRNPPRSSKLKYFTLSRYFISRLLVCPFSKETVFTIYRFKIHTVTPLRMTLGRTSAGSRILHK